MKIALPNHSKLCDDANEDAEIAVSALLQAFAMPGVDEAQIRALLIKSIAGSQVRGFALGWDAALQKAEDALAEAERFVPAGRT